MATLAEAEQHRMAVHDVSTIAVGELVNEWGSLPTGDPQGLPAPLFRLLDELIGDFSAMTGTLGADFYEQLRDDAAVAGSYVAVLADAPPREQVEASASWAAMAAYVDEHKALADSAAFLDRMLADRDRATIALNVDRDPASPRFARYASAGACAFCAMTALRGPVYRSESSAAKKYHQHCHCIAVPVWSPDQYEEAPYVADWRNAYYSATEQLGGAKDTKAILAHMRQSAGLR